MKFPESALAHKYLDELAKTSFGIEIGGSSHNPFGIPHVINIDYTGSEDTIYKQQEFELCGEKLPVDLVSFADNLPFPDDSYSFLINSHVFEHQCNSIRCLHEWRRVIKKDGILFTIIPKRDALEADAILPITTLAHQISDYESSVNYETHEIPEGSSKFGHYHIYDLDSFLELIGYMNRRWGKGFETIECCYEDDKVKNGFMCVHKILK